MGICQITDNVYFSPNQKTNPTMKRILPLPCTLLLLLIHNASMYGQIVFEEKGDLVSPTAYDKMIAEDFGYLILSDNSPQQGIAATVNDDGSNIKINGLLYSGNYGILGIEANLNASNGVYFFDEENGTEKGKISLNYYKSLFTLSSYSNPSNVKKVKTQLDILDYFIDAKSKHLKYTKLIEDNVIAFGLDTLTFKDELGFAAVSDKLRKLARKYINSQDIQGYELIPIRKIDDKDIKIDTTYTAIEIKVPKFNKKEIEYLKISKPTQYDLKALLDAYLKNKNFVLKELEDKINTTEINNADSQWLGKHITFLGLSPFYQRESFKRFTYDESKAFANMFNTTLGDVYGITASFNYNYNRGPGRKTAWFPNQFFSRLSVSASRASNISTFTNSSFNFSNPMGNDVNGNPILIESTKSAYNGTARYEYGTSNSFMFEVYYYPFALPVGLFGYVGYQYINFSRLKDVEDKEISPMRFGLLFNLKNKEKDKPLVTIQTFIDRTDLSLSPNGKDNDLRFGVGVGLPINIK